MKPDGTFSVVLDRKDVMVRPLRIGFSYFCGTLNCESSTLKTHGGAVVSITVSDDLKEINLEDIFGKIHLR
jgi:hypothetical protein